MKKVLILLIFSSSLFALSEKELELKVQELKLKEKELQLQEQQLANKPINVIINNDNQNQANSIATASTTVVREKNRQGIYLTVSGTSLGGIRESTREFATKGQKDKNFPDIDEQHIGWAIHLGFGEFDANRIEISYINRYVDVDMDNIGKTKIDESKLNRNDMKSLAIDFIVTGFQSGDLLPYLKFGIEYGEYSFSKDDKKFYLDQNVKLHDDSRTFFGGRLGAGVFYRFNKHFEISLGGEVVYIGWSDVETPVIGENNRIDIFTADNIMLGFSVGLTYRF
jgi:opacity protein-like surface antigen